MMQRINYIFNLISQSDRFLTLIPSAQSLISEAHFIMLKSFSPIKIICTLESLENGNFECINSTFELSVTAKTFVRIFIRKKINRKNEKNWKSDTWKIGVWTLGTSLDEKCDALCLLSTQLYGWYDNNNFKGNTSMKCVAKESQMHKCIIHACMEKNQNSNGKKKETMQKASEQEEERLKWRWKSDFSLDWIGFYSFHLLTESSWYGYSVGTMNTL